jgi:D-aminopeptidase
VAETYDGVLNDINGQHLTERHALDAMRSAKPGPVAEGNIGGGTGMICYEFKGGTGTSSRRINIDGQDFTVAALVQANHGIRPWLTILGVPVGRHLTDDRLLPRHEQGSIIVILATDIPMMPHQLNRLARRAAIGIGRGGTPGGNGSGDIFLAFSVANPMPLSRIDQAFLSFDWVNDEQCDPIYLAAVESVEEAVVNALLAAEDMTTLRPAGHICRALDHDQLLAIMKQYGHGCRERS